MHLTKAVNRAAKVWEASLAWQQEELRKQEEATNAWLAESAPQGPAPGGA